MKKGAPVEEKDMHDDPTLALIKEAEALKASMDLYAQLAHGAGIRDAADLCGLLEATLDGMRERAGELTYAELNGAWMLAGALKGAMLGQATLTDEFCTALERVETAVKRRKALEGK